MDLTAAGSKTLAGTGAGTGPSDQFTQNVIAPAVETTLGAPADAAWGGTGSGGVVALLKALWTALTATLTVQPVSGAQWRIGAQGAAGDATIVNAGVAQALFAGTTPANGFAVHNPDAFEDMWVSDSTTAAANGEGSMIVAAGGGSYETPPGYRPIGAVSVYALTAGHKITARRW